MAKDYAYFNYSLPEKTATYYADSAIALLRKIKEKYPAFYNQFRCPSEVLTLSGVRALDTYYKLGGDATRQDIDGLKHLLRSHNIFLIEENFDVYGGKNEEHYYSLAHANAILEIPRQYRHLPAPGWVPPDFAAIEKDTDFFLWWALWKNAIIGRHELEKPLQTWLTHNHMAIHNLTLGILLGYPGEAICSCLYETEKDYEQGHIKQAHIKYASAFDGAHPIYSFHEDVALNPHIKAHETLWSDILANVYAAIEPKLIGHN